MDPLARFCDTNETLVLYDIPEPIANLLVYFSRMSLEGYADELQSSWALWEKRAFDIAFMLNMNNADYVQRVINILDILGPVPRSLADSGPAEVCQLRTLYWVGNSCYLDATLFSLFVNPCPFVLERVLGDSSIGGTVRCSDDPTQDEHIRQRIRNALKRAYQSIHREDDANQAGVTYTCTAIRKELAKCQNGRHAIGLGGQDTFADFNPKEAAVFLVFILGLYDTNVAHKSFKVFGTNIVGQDMLDPADITMTRANVDRKSSIIQSVEASHLQNPDPIDIKDFLSLVEDTTLDGWSHLRRIEVLTVLDAPMLVFGVRRFIWQGGDGEEPEEDEEGDIAEEGDEEGDIAEEGDEEGDIAEEGDEEGDISEGEADTAEEGGEEMWEERGEEEEGV